MTSLQASKGAPRLAPPPTSHSPNVTVEGEVAASFVVALYKDQLFVAFHDSHFQAIGSCHRKAENAEIVGSGVRSLQCKEGIQLTLEDFALFLVSRQQILRVLEEGFPGKEISIRTS